jgi:hypothetical protein
MSVAENKIEVLPGILPVPARHRPANPLWQGAACVALAALLAGPSFARADSSALPTTLANATRPAPQEPDIAQGAQDPEQEKRDREQEKRDREQEKRDREQEKRDREQEARDRQQERLDRASELYQDGREDLDENRYDQAEAKFAELAALSASQTDAALYWKAYAENRLGKREASLATIEDLKHRFPQSRWQKDASALEIEVRQRTGQPAHPEMQSDDELKMLAIQGLMNTDPERAMPLLEKVLNSTDTPREKSKALFVIAQSGSPEARAILVRIAKGNGNPELQRKAIEYLGMFGGGRDGVKGGVLNEIYSSSSDESVKRTILKGYMMSGDKDDLFAAAKGEKDPTLRREAIRQLGLVHGIDELQQLYQRETSTEVKREILQSFFLAGDSGRLVEAAKTEKDPELRRAAVRNLGLINSADSGKALQTIYAKEGDRDVRREVLNAYFIQGNVSGLVGIARTEKDPELKKEAVSKLALMHSKEATDYLMEILQK